MKDTLMAAMRKHAGFGAMDSEGWHAVERIEAAIRDGKPYPLRGDNPFEIYSSMDGWEVVSAELDKLGREFWRAGITERLGL